MFANPRAIPAVPATRGLEIVAAAGVTHEVELLARRIKKLLVTGDSADGDLPVRPADILVVFRALDESTVELVREVFRAYGIPAAIGRARRSTARPRAHAAAVVAARR